MLEMKFNENEIPQSIREAVLEAEIEAKMKPVKVNGASCDISYRSWNIEYDEDVVLTSTQVAKCKTLFNKNYKEKKAKVEGLIKKFNYVLSDVKLYPKVLASLEDATYCVAEAELQNLHDKFLKGYASSKAVYRTRASKFSAMECV